MAGAGFKTFVDGDILTAAEVNTYLMEQSVMVFASAAARTTAIAAPSEGMITYLADTNAVEKYTGSAWVNVNDNTDAILKTIVDAKGDLIAGTAADTVDRLAVGTNGHVLTADSSTATGLKWAAPAGGGKLLQVVSSVYSTSVTVSTATFTDTGLSATITPTLNTSKILVLVSQPLLIERATNNAQGALRLMRDSTEVYETGGTGFMRTIASYANGATAIEAASVTTVSYLDSPATTSAVTYKTQIRPVNTTNTQRIWAQVDSADSSMVLLEIGA